MRPGLPDRVHRHGRHGHEGPLPRSLGRPGDVRRAAQGDLGAVEEILAEHDYDPRHLLAMLEATQAAYGYLPVAALKRISQVTGTWYAQIYGAASFYGHLRFEPPSGTAQAAAMTSRRPGDAAFVASLGAALGDRPDGRA
ncbi:MAG: NAD(P)H-dependent oxidoreductase subunit E [Chloroflexi bacterium]|nr:NAD(P)H-dependent oxidoreductase subunit E [Chloroflexota bacterium]